MWNSFRTDALVGLAELSDELALIEVAERVGERRRGHQCGQSGNEHHTVHNVPFPSRRILLCGYLSCERGAVQRRLRDQLWKKKRLHVAGAKSLIS